MGFGQETNRNATFVNIVGGKFAVKCNEDTPNAVSRKNKKEETVWELNYPDLTATLKSVSCEKNEKLGSWQYKVTLDDFGDTYILNVPCESKYGDNLACKVPNLKVNNVYTFKPYDFEDKVKKNNYTGKPMKQTGISITDASKEKIASAFTSEVPNGRPTPTERMDEDEYKIFQLQVRKFYRKVVDEFNGGKNESQVVKAQNNASPTKEDVMARNNQNDDFQDLPFMITALIGLSTLVPMFI
jgi:hypothetical protein